MATQAQSELYPFSTQDGKIIQLDIIKPLALTAFTFTTSFLPCTIFDKNSVSTLFATEDCIVDLTNTMTVVTNNTKYDDCLFLPKNTIVVASLPGTVGGINIGIKGFSAAGQLFIQGIQKWAAVALARQIAIK